MSVIGSIYNRTLRCPTHGRSHVTAGIHLGVSDRLNNAIRSHDVALDNCGGKAFNYGAQAVGWCRCRVQKRAID